MAFRRLTRREYNNTVRDLLGDASAPAKDFVLDGTLGWFENNTDAPMTALSATQYADTAESLARAAVASKLTTIAPCAAAGDDACARDFVRSFGKRAYRRPLTQAEATRLDALFARGRASAPGGFGNGVRLVLQALLSSPHFLHHVELGVPGAATGGLVPLSPYEVAARLSYFLLGGPPDAALMQAADAGKLASPADIEAQAARLLADARTRAGTLGFVSQWLALDKIEKADKDTKLYPQWTTALRQKLREEAEAFTSHVLWEGDSRLSTLLSAPFTFANAASARLYDVTSVSGDALTKISLDPMRRAGLLTQAGLLAANAHFDQTSPVHRGLFVRERMLCQVTPSPPDDVEVRAPRPDPKLTTRQRFAAHTADPTCRGCHVLMDPIGLGFENYDPIGRFRSTENGQPVDASGHVVGTSTLDGGFNGAVELAGKLAKSPEVHECLTAQHLAYATGAPAEALKCAASGLAAEFTAGGSDLRKLMLALVKSDAFRFRTVIKPEACR